MKIREGDYWETAGGHVVMVTRRVEPCGCMFGFIECSDGLKRTIDGKTVFSYRSLGRLTKRVHAGFVIRKVLGRWVVWRYNPFVRLTGLENDIKRAQKWCNRMNKMYVSEASKLQSLPPGNYTVSGSAADELSRQLLNTMLKKGIK